MINIDKTYQQAQTDRGALGIQKAMMHTYLKPINAHSQTPAQTSTQTPVNLQQLATYAQNRLQKGDSFNVASKQITYGINFKTGAFYIKGVDRNRQNIWIDIDAQGNVIEKGKMVTKSGWVEWALPIVVHDLKANGYLKNAPTFQNKPR